MLVVILVIAIAFLFIIQSIIKFILNWWKFLKLASKIPGSKWQIPLIGVLPKFIGADLHEFFNIVMKIEKNVKGAEKVWFGTELTIIVNSPEALQKVLNSKDCLDKPSFFKFFDIQNASLFGNLHAWKSHRKILNPAFSAFAVKQMIPIFNEKSRNFLNILEEKCDKKEFDVYPHMSAFFLETILNAAFELNVNIHSDKNKDEYVKYFDDFYSAVTSRMMKPWLYFEPFYKLSPYYKMEMNGRTKGSLKFVDEILKNARDNACNNNNNDDTYKSAVKVLLDPANKLNNQEIREEIVTLLVAAQDSTTIVVSMTLLMLAMHKSVQQKVVDELREVFTSADEENDFEKMNKLQYMEMVIKEILRLFPISAFTMRKTTSDFELNDFIIPKGSNLFLSIFPLQRNKEYFGEDAQQFIPERFETERIKMIHPYAYLPFSGGPRLCIGNKYAMMFMKTFLTHFLRKYELDTSLKYEELEFRVSVTLKITQETKISIKKRKF